MRHVADYAYAYVYAYAYAYAYVYVYINMYVYVYVYVYVYTYMYVLCWVPALCLPAARSSEPTPEEVEAVRARAAAAGFPSQRISEQQFQEMQQQSVSHFEGAGERRAHSSKQLRAGQPALLLESCSSHRPTSPPSILIPTCPYAHPRRYPHGTLPQRSYAGDWACCQGQGCEGGG